MIFSLKPGIELLQSCRFFSTCAYRESLHVIYL